MTDKQRLVLRLGVLVALLLGLFPPYSRVKVWGNEKIDQPSVYGFLFAPPETESFIAEPATGYYEYSLDAGRLFAQWGVILVLIWVLYASFDAGTRKKNEEGAPAL